ncbi:hypothetical protein P5673_023018 [Acropora cervicornis]|uniref:Secreted protein n=1 Tax=Acropora cervicornis TaxID=6130 RepID=A0AAD9Q6P1_ACRCE|nr:hypothetical protein P5673_022983 [Acropora cervicornis]KAK2555379.1 hypothetical protein P5673_023018 [Acropora cervicornis]
MMISILVLVIWASFTPSLKDVCRYLQKHCTLMFSWSSTCWARKALRGSAHSIVERVKLGRKRKRVIQD